MKAKKLFAVLLASTMIASLVACGNTATTTPETTTETTTDASATTDTEVEEDTETAAETDAAVANPSTDFSDGLFGFIGSDKTVNPSGDDSVFSMSEFNGSAAVKVEPQGKSPFVGIQMDKLVGDKIADVAAVSVTIGIESADGKFYAASGKISDVLGGSKQSSTSWSIYKENGNPKTVTHTLAKTAAEGDYVVVSLESDVAADNGAGQSTLYILDVTFLDASGNTIAVDTSAEYAAAATGADRTNLYGITGAVTVDLAGSGAGWSQIGYQDLTDEEWEALTTPGSVVEIEYKAETGNIWMGLSGNAWTRLGVGDCDGSGQGYSYYNNSRSIAQITYEDIVSVCGDDTSSWDKQIFVESDGEFEVFSIKIGQQAPNLVLTNAIDISEIGCTGTGAGWGQIGYVDIPDDAFEMLKTPGSMVKIEYSAVTDDIWMGLSGNQWLRVGVGDADGSGTPDAITDGSVCYVTYDMIAQVCGDDTSAWDKQIFIESNDAFEVYSVQVGMAGEFIPNRKQLDAGISGAGCGAWSQLGDGISDEVFEALQQPGSVINISYKSETGECWVVMPWASAGWIRVGVGDYDGSGQGYAVFDGSTCQITHDMIAEWCGDDASTWGNCIQVEASSTYDVYSVTVGQTN